ncbi:MAG: DEAD/DEAH box helicase [Thermosphaera sp.]
MRVMGLMTKNVLERKGYSFIFFTDPPVEPSYSSLKFKDVLPEFSSIELGDKPLYKHQLEAYESLMKGLNVLLKAGTGSGKTEAWMLYALNRIREDKRFRTIALYPTLALANDQIRRIEKYVGLVGGKSIQIDSVKKEEYVKKHGLPWLREAVGSSNIIISNPAFLMHDLKKYLLRKTQGILAGLYSKLDLIIIDELDFYDPRSLALLMGVLQILSDISDVKPQVAVLTATLSNPEDMGDFLKKATGRDYRVVEGEAFRITNHYYIVLGKNMREVYNSVRRLWGEAVKAHPELANYTKFVEDYSLFEKEAYRIVSILEGLGFDVPSISVNPAEIVSEFFKDDYVTLVFTRSISSAEELVRSIKQYVGEDAPLASHHHLISKAKREEVEEKARRGLVKVVVSPRTLSQGIDIGTIRRIVHLGLPDDVKEFYQREGRKGRRRELGYAETVIIPYTRWDRELLNNGLETLRKWLGLGIEKTLVNEENLYIYLFTGIVKLKSPWYRKELNELEKNALSKAGVLLKDRVNTELLDWVFERMNFYEFAPPYGIKRYIERSGELRPLEPIGHVDLIEKFQPGCIDYSEDALVVSIEYGRTSRLVKSVIEKPIKDIDFYSHDALSIAAEEYKYWKMNWGEKPSLVKDLLTGRITSEELCVVYVPRNGFGRYRKIPERCIWTVRSEKPRYVRVDNTPLVFYDKKTIYVPTPTGGEYRDFTYGYIYEVEISEDSELLRLALAALMVLLRRLHGIAFETIMYDVVKLGEYKYFSLHEPVAAGIIDRLDWLSVRRDVEKYVFDDLDRILISEIDDIAYSTLVSLKFNWSLVKAEMLRVVDYILAKEKIRAVIEGVETLIPRPSPALKTLSLSIISEVLDEDSLSPSLLVALAYYDGGLSRAVVELYPPIPYVKPPQAILEFEREVLDKILYEDFKLVVEDRGMVLKQLRTANLRMLAGFIEKEPGKVVDLREKSADLSVKPFTPESLLTGEEKEPRIEPADVQLVLKEARERKELSESMKNVIQRFMARRARADYIAYLVLKEVAGRKGVVDRSKTGVI